MPQREEEHVAESLDSKVLNWINSTGAPLEMRSAQTMLRAGLQADLGQYYTDPDSGQSREIDLLAGLQVQARSEDRAAFLAVVECKYAPTPWVLFRPPKEHSTSITITDERITTRFGRPWLDLVTSEVHLDWDGIWVTDSQPGYSLHTSSPISKRGRPDQPRSSNDNPKDLAFAALMTVTKATEALSQSLSEAKDQIVFGILFPVIVVRGHLYETWLDDTGEPQIMEIEAAQMWWNRPSGKQRVLVDVVTEPMLPEFARQFDHSAQQMLTQGIALTERVSTLPFQVL